MDNGATISCVSILAMKFSAGGVMRSSIGRTGFRYCRFMSTRNIWGRATSTASGGEPAILAFSHQWGGLPHHPVGLDIRWGGLPRHPAGLDLKGRGCPGFAADRLPSPRWGKSQQRPARQRACPGLSFTTDLRWCTSARVLGLVILPGKGWTLSIWSG